MCAVRRKPSCLKSYGGSKKSLDVHIFGNQLLPIMKEIDTEVCDDKIRIILKKFSKILHSTVVNTTERFIANSYLHPYSEVVFSWIGHAILKKISIFYLRLSHVIPANEHLKLSTGVVMTSGRESEGCGFVT